MSVWRRLVTTFSLVWAIASLATAASAANGPYDVTSTGLYQFLGRSEPLVATDRRVDLWAQIYRPSDLSKKPFPLIIFLHGNHGTCGHFDPTLQVRVDDRSDYTTTGKCTAGYTVTPNHLGYAYMAEELASYGYIVVSINANRGITAGAGLPDDRGLNLMRGRLILRHLALLSGWNRGSGPITPPVSLGFNPVGTMDFSQVGFMGHSRGGEGARAALQQFRDANSPFPALIGPIAIKSIFEIGPVDGQTSRVLDANGVNSIILLPACDGDVSNLQGIHVFDRVFLRTTPDSVQAFHGTGEVWGADHDAYNSEWLTADSTGCSGTDPIFPQSGRSMPQQVTARDMLVPFFRATVGATADKSLAALFDPTNDIPASIADITYVARGYLPAPKSTTVQLLERFSKPTGESDKGVPTTAVGVSVVQQEAAPEHYKNTRVATVSWTPASPKNRYFQVNFGASEDFSASQALSFRTALRCSGVICDRKATTRGELYYQVALVDSNGQVSNPVTTTPNDRISRPIGDTSTNLHSVLYTVEMQLSAFHGIDKGHIKSVRFVFDYFQSSIVDVTDLALLKVDPLADLPTMSVAAAARQAPARVAAAASPTPLPSPTAAADGNSIRIAPQTAAGDGGASASARAAGSPMTDIILSSKRTFPVTNAFPKLRIGDAVLEDGSVSADGKTLTVSVPTATYDQLPAGSNVSLQVLSSSPVWQFGGLPK